MGLAILVALLATVTFEPSAGAATATRTWVARLGNVADQLGSNGTAIAQVNPAGMAILSLQFTGLLHGAEYPVVLFQGRFMAAGSSWSSRGGNCLSLRLGAVRRLMTVRTDARGAVTRTVLVPTSVAKLFQSTPRRMAIAVGEGTTARCGSFALQPTPVAMPATPSPTPSLAPPLSGPCDAWPGAIATILAVLSTPDGLCLRLFADGSVAPAFVRAAGGIYFPDPPTVYYLLGSAGGDETRVLSHEVCHAHQDRVTRDEGQTALFGWDRTAAGAEYIEVTGWRDRNGEWVQPHPWGTGYVSPLEENADLCAIWFDPLLGPRFLRREAPSRFAWAQRWLPLPSFIIPYRLPAGSATAE